MSSPAATCILAINGGSSSIRFALFTGLAAPQVLVRGKIDRIGQADMTFEHHDAAGHVQLEQTRGATDHGAAVELLLNWMRAQPWIVTLAGIGHRVVHGMQHALPELISTKLLAELERLVAFDPQHMPRELALIAAFRKQCPQVPQLACFDTAFHRGMPQVAKLLAIPRRYQAAGVERYGFHGLSYAYCMEELRRAGDPAATRGRVILAHLGSGASLAAVLDGNSIDTSMGFTPAGGVPMGSRSGDLDPGVGYYLARTEGLSPDQFHRMVSNESGLLGISATSSDLRELLAREGEDTRAAEAVALFCYQVRKWIGSFAAALGGVDTLVFTGGAGEKAALIRARICDALGFLGISLDATRNYADAALISKDGGRTNVRVIRTDEELMIARAVSQHLATA
jgi:acetate kinase